MPAYQIMREHRFDPLVDDWRPACIWATDGEQIIVRARPAHKQLEMTSATRVQSSLSAGFTIDSIWRYLADDGGNGYTDLRDAPVTVEAETLERAAQVALRAFLDA
jgi:hypothetical protein